VGLPPWVPPLEGDWPEKDENAKLMREPSGFPLDELELREALLPCRLCLLWWASSSLGGGTRTMVSLLEVARVGLLLTEAWVPQGSEAETEPLRAESLRARVGLMEGLLDGDAVGSAATLMEACN